MEEEIYRNIESSVEPLNPHPDESFRAGVALCKATVTVVVKNLVRGTPEKIAEIALAVQEIVMDRVSRMVMASYVDYLLTKVKETQFEERRRYSGSCTTALHTDDGRNPKSGPLPDIQGERRRARGETACPGPGVGRESLDLMHEFAKELRLLETSDGLEIAGEPHEDKRTRRCTTRSPWKVRAAPPRLRARPALHGLEGRGAQRSRPLRFRPDRGRSRDHPKHITARVRDHGTGLDAEDGTTEGWA